MTVVGVEVIPEVVALGVSFGLVYGLLAVGLVLAYRVSAVINFAHADIGVAVATVFAVAVTRWQVPYWVGLPAALALGGVVGVVTHAAVVRRLARVPRLVSVVASLGLGQLLRLTATAIAGASVAVAFPEPPGLPTFDVGMLHVGRPTTAMLLGGPVVVLGLWAWLGRSRNGLQLRAVAANPPAAQLLGLPAARLSALGWGVAGSLSVLTAVLVGAAPRFIGGNVSGPGLLLRALAGGMVAGMHSLPGALAAGVAIGVLEQVSLWNLTQPGFVDVLLLGVIVAALLLRRRPHGQDRQATSDWVRLDVWRPLPDRVAALPAVRRAARGSLAVAVLILTTLPAVVSNRTAVVLTAVIAFAVVGLSVGIVSGLGGRLSLGQFAIAGTGAVASAHTVIATGNFLLGFAAAAVAGTVTATVAGLPALRSSGPFLAVTTLAFALAAETWLLPHPWALGSGLDAGKPLLGTLALESGRAYYLVALIVGAAVLWLCRNFRRSGVARRLVAVRDNPEAAAAFGVDATRSVFLSFALGGAIAGLGGAVYGHSLAVITPAAFPVSASIAVAVMAVIGGLGYLLGPVVGAVYVIAVPAFLPLDAAWLAATAIGWLLLVLYLPEGLARPIVVLRDHVVGKLTGGTPPESPASDTAGGGERPLAGPMRAAQPAGALSASGLRRTFNGVTAVDGVDLSVEPGEIVGVLGANGAGKTTLLNLLAGTLAADTGQVLLGADDISRLPAHRRAQLGIARSFQANALFPTLAVIDVLRLALECDRPTRIGGALLGLDRGDDLTARRARQAIAAFGLGAFADQPVHTLSTGTRRVCELAALSVMRPQFILLDEPSAGLAQSEVERLGPLLLSLRDRVGAGLVVVEHDVRLVDALADRVLIMDRGRLRDPAAGPVVEEDPQIPQL